jgi:mandelate racemase
VTESPLVLTDVITSDGSIGPSIVFTYSAALLRPTAQLVEYLGATIRGSAMSPVHVFDDLTARFRLPGTQGITGTATPLSTWRFGTNSRGHGTYLLQRRWAACLGVCAETATEWLNRGFKGVKAKIGYATPQEDLEVVRAIREAVGPDMSIMVDYNQSLTPTDAIVRLKILEAEGLTWIEEPTCSHDFTGHAAIAREIQTPIQAGENWWGSSDLRQAISAGSSDYIMLDAMKIGGVTGWMRAAAFAAAHGLRISNHLWPEWSAQMLSVTPNAHWLEYADWWSAILREPVNIEDGRAVATTRAGSGIEWDEIAVTRFAA